MPISKEQIALAEGKKKSAAMRFILLTIFIDLFGVGLIIPVLVPFVGQLTSHPAQQTFWVFCVLIAFALTSFIFAPVLGSLSDMVGRRKILLFGFFGFALTWFVTAFASSVWMLLIIRIVAGCMQANVGVASAYIADITSVEKRAQNYGLMGATIGLAFVIGPAIGGFLGSYQLTLPFYFAGTLAILNLIYGIFVLPESLPVEKRQAKLKLKTNPLITIIQAFADKKIRYLLAILMLCFVIQGIISATFILYTELKFGWGPKQNGIALFCVGLMMIITQGFTLKHLLKYFGYFRLCLMASINGVLMFLLMAFSNYGWLIFVAIFTSWFTNALVPSVQGILSGRVDAYHQGQIMGVTAAMNSLSNVIGPIIGPLLLYFLTDYGGFHHASMAMGTPFLIGALTYLAIFILIFFKPDCLQTTEAKFTH